MRANIFGTKKSRGSEMRAMTNANADVYTFTSSLMSTCFSESVETDLRNAATSGRVSQFMHVF